MYVRTFYTRRCFQLSGLDVLKDKTLRSNTVILQNASPNLYLYRFETSFRFIVLSIWYGNSAGLLAQSV